MARSYYLVNNFQRLVAKPRYCPSGRNWSEEIENVVERANDGVCDATELRATAVDLADWVAVDLEDLAELLTVALTLVSKDTKDGKLFATIAREALVEMGLVQERTLGELVKSRRWRKKGAVKE